MNRKDFESLGDRHKRFEGLSNQYMMSDLPIMVRLDGRAFHTFTKGLKRPYDARFSVCMIETTKFLVKETNALIGYTQSDEITLILPAASEHIFGGRKSKIESITAALASTCFFKYLITNLPEKTMQTPVFDSRCWQYPNEELCVESLIWREADATRNSLTMACSAYFSQKQLQGVGRSKQHDMLHSVGVNWNDYPTYFKRGTYVQRKVMDQETWGKIPDKSKPESRTFMRSEVMVIDMDPINSVSNILEVVFGGADPYDG